jgi:predicted DNA-binding ribbon-helix-helix protein
LSFPRNSATGIVVEDAIWDRLRLIAAEQGVTISKLIGDIDRRYRLEPPIPGKRQVRSLSSAVRIFVLEHMEAAIGADAIKRALAIAAKTQIKGDTNHPSS